MNSPFYSHPHHRNHNNITFHPAIMLSNCSLKSYVFHFTSNYHTYNPLSIFTHIKQSCKKKVFRYIFTLIWKILHTFSILHSQLRTPQCISKNYYWIQNLIHSKLLKFCTITQRSVEERMYIAFIFYITAKALRTS